MSTGDKLIPEGFYQDLDGSFKRRECSCGKSNQEIDNCLSCKPKINGMTGWVCPVCGRGNSPFSSSCPCKPFPQWPVIVGPTNLPLNNPTFLNPSINPNNQTISQDGK